MLKTDALDHYIQKVMQLLALEHKLPVDFQGPLPNLKQILNDPWIVGGRLKGPNEPHTSFCNHVKSFLENSLHFWFMGILSEAKFDRVDVAREWRSVELADDNLQEVEQAVLLEDAW